MTLEALTAMGVQVVFAALGSRRVPATSPAPEVPLSSGEVDDDTYLRWFNHRGRRGYAGPVVEPPDGAVVVGHGVAAIDCARSLSFLRAVSVLSAHGKQTGSIPLHRSGVLGTVAQHGLSLDAIGLGVTRLYLGSSDTLLP
ncbi:MAG TPA: hypothetical protein PK095_25865, partial [Myxococcota bacterium]|nr:hypothetical protein [Myxococcota bacterium]